MNRPKSYLTVGLVAAFGLAAGGLLTTSGVFAADHAEAPALAGDDAADIADFFIWTTEDDTIVTVLTFAGLAEAGSEPVYDTEVLYTIHFDINDGFESDAQIYARFGTNGEGDFGLQVTGMPGVDGLVEGPVETVINTGSSMAYAGPRDDPFFFDLDGFLDTVQVGDLMFDPSNDSFAGTNVTAIVLEFDLVEAIGENASFRAWVTTARLP